MYDNHRKLWQCQLSICTCLIAAVLLSAGSTKARAQELQSSSLIRKISGLSDKLELTTNTSRILTLDKNIPRVQVNNPDLLAVTPLSATQVQISAKKAGVTQVNLWDSEGKVHSVDVLIYGDARELEVALQTQFPHASIKVFRYSESLVLTGYVDRADHVSPIMQLAADYSPKVINNITVGGVQQILLKVRVMEISRTKLRDLGADWAFLDGDNILAASSVSGLLSTSGGSIGSAGTLAKAADSAGQTFQFGVFNGGNDFIAVLSALQQCRVAKILAEPNIVAVSGRPAQFNVGGEFPVLIPQSLGTTSIEYKPYGTQIDFLPIVLGNGNIRLEVRPRISEIDPARSVVLNGNSIPALTVRQVDTAVEMKAGQTFGLAGLVQERSDSVNRGLPYLSDMPIIGVPFRRMRDETNEIELLIMVTPEFVDPIDACEAPCGGPGTYTTSPNNRGLYCGGYMEVPTACNPTSGLGSCGQDPCGRCNNGCQCNGAPVMNGGMPAQGMPTQNMMPTPATQMPGGTGYDDSANGTTVLPSPDSEQNTKSESPVETPPASPTPQELTLPASAPKPAEEKKPAAQPPLPPQPAAPATPEPALPKPTQTPPAAPVPGPTPNGAYNEPMSSGYTYVLPPSGPYSSIRTAPDGATNAVGSAPRSYTPQRQPVFMRNASSPNNPQPQPAQQAAPARENSLIGPVGYEQ